MKKLIFAVMIAAATFTMSSCDMLGEFLTALEDQQNQENNNGNENGNENGGNTNVDLSTITRDEMKEQGFAFKMELLGNTVYLTRKGSSTRVDVIYKDGDHEVFIETKGSDGYYTGYGYDYSDKGWTMDEDQARQAANNTFANFEDRSKIYLKYGYEEKGTTEILGCTCTVYEGTLAERTGYVMYPELGNPGLHGYFALWNGYLLLSKADKIVWDDATESEVTKEVTVAECKAIQIGIPDTAFDQVLEVSWIK